MELNRPCASITVPGVELGVRYGLWTLLMVTHPQIKRIPDLQRRQPDKDDLF
jgi:hypothetical protein